ncbi:MAG: hypothetical protein R3B70_12650 [Polyangiaceae bacterium]
MAAAGYEDRAAAGFWSKSGRQLFDASHFYLPTAVLDPFGRTTTITYDPYLLFATEVSDPLGNTATADLDYRLLAPWQTTDPNGNRSQVAFDALGRVTKVAVMGKAGSTDGDTPADPTVLYTYALDEWNDTDGAKPAYVKTEHREEHGAANTRWQTSYAFLDGAGAAAMVKVNAEPAASNGPARWVATGRTVVNNKGNPIKQYEPLLLRQLGVGVGRVFAEIGVTLIVTYDALGRALRTDLPDGTFARIEAHPVEAHPVGPERHRR